MSLRERLGDFDAVNGKTASEYAQERTDAINAEIRRPGRRINVISEEEWSRMVAKAKKKYEEEQAKRKKEEDERKSAREKALVPFQERVEREKKFPSLIEDKLVLYHEPAGEEEYDEKKWKPVYKQTSPFLAKVVLAYRYGVDKANGRLAGEDLNYFGGHDLPSYLRYRGLPLDKDETDFFSTILSKKLDYPKFQAVALTASIEALSKNNSLAETVDLLGFILEDDVTQIEINELVLE